MKILLVLVLFLLLGFHQTLFARIAECELLSQRWEKKYRTDFNMSDMSNETNITCPSPLANFVMSLYNVELLNFKANENGPALNFYQYIKDNVTTFKHVEKGNGKDVAGYVNRVIFPNTIFITDHGLSLSPESYSEILIHETRHTFNNDPTHVNCTIGPYKDQKACDETFYGTLEQGSGYNAGYFFTKSVALSTTYSYYRKSLYLLEMKQMLTERFLKFQDEEVYKNEYKNATARIISDNRNLNSTYDIEKMNIVANFPNRSSNNKRVIQNLKFNVSDDPEYITISYDVSASFFERSHSPKYAFTIEELGKEILDKIDQKKLGDDDIKYLLHEIKKKHDLFYANKTSFFWDSISIDP